MSLSYIRIRKPAPPRRHAKPRFSDAPMSHSQRLAYQRSSQAEPASYYALADEHAVEIRINGESIAVLMATPEHLHDLARGFAITEGYILTDTKIARIQARPIDAGVIVDMSIDDETLAGRTRSMAARSSCGLCGVTTLAEAIAETPILTGAPPPARAAVLRSRANLAEWQPLNRKTHSVHAAAWCDTSGTIGFAREDIGRHNALDKLLGARAQTADIVPGYVFVSSRVSYELVQKCAMAGVTTLVAVSAPTTFAVRLAEAANINLIAMARDDSDWVFVSSVARVSHG